MITTKTTKKRKISNINVKNIEEEIILLREGEEDYVKNGGIDAKIAYKRGLDFIHNLKL